MRLLFLLLLLAGAALAQDPVKQMPDAYRQVFENEYVRVQFVHYAPRVKLGEHDHPANGTAYVYLTDAGPVVYGHIGLSYGAVTRPAVKAGSFRLYKAVQETHTVENVSDTTSDFLRVEFKTVPARDPNTLRGKYFRFDASAGESARAVQFENEQVRITRVLCAAGAACEEAVEAKEPSLWVALTSLTLAPGRGARLQLAAGQTRWFAAGRREAWKNAGAGAAEWLRFDFKTEPAKAAPPDAPHKHPENAGDAAKKAEASAQLKRGAALAAAGKLAEAIDAHEQSLALDPGLVQSHINLISLYGRTRQFARAEAHYRDGLAINPDLPDLHFNYGVLLAAAERNADALKAFEQCLALNPYSAEAHFNAAGLIEQTGRLEDAAAHYRTAVANQAGYRAAHFGLGRILINQGKAAEAIEEFQRAVTPPPDASDPDAPRYLYALGATYARAGETAKGIACLRDALQRATALQQTPLVQGLTRDLQALEQGR